MDASTTPNNTNRTSWGVSFVVVLAIVILNTHPAFTQSGSYAGRAIGAANHSAPSPRRESPVVSFTPIKLGNDSTIQLISSPSLAELGRELLLDVRSIHGEFSQMFGGITGIHNTLRVIDAEEFYALTRLPSWTNAMFFRSQVVIPIDRSRPLDTQDLRRSLRHEYFHAITHALSQGRCPGWLDEGLAQHLEGSSPNRLWSALSQWVRSRDMVPFQRLSRGFTKLPNEMVAPAYAQSLVAARMIRTQFGMPAVRSFLERLKRGDDGDVAFRIAFGLPPAAFHERVRQNIISGRFKRDDYR